MVLCLRYKRTSPTAASLYVGVPGGTSVRAWLVQYRAVPVETFAFQKKKTPVTRTHVYMNFPRFNLHLVIHDLVHMHFFPTLMIRNR